MSETRRPTDGLRWYHKLVAAVFVVPILGIIVAALWGGFAWMVRWAW